MVPGHTKFKCDGSFGLIKKLYRKTSVDCVDHVVDVVKRSSPAGLNKAQCYEGGKGFQYLDIKAILGIYFKKLPSIQKYQHFLFEASNLDTVKVQGVANGPFAEFNLLKTKKAGIFEEIKSLSILVLTPSHLDYKRQEYLYQNIRPFVRDEFKDITCSILATNKIFKIKSLP